MVSFQRHQRLPKVGRVSQLGRTGDVNLSYDGPLFQSLFAMFFSDPDSLIISAIIRSLVTEVVLYKASSQTNGAMDSSVVFSLGRM